MLHKRYARPRPNAALTKAQKDQLLAEYFEWCRKTASVDPDKLNLKLPRDAFSDLLDEFGALLQQRSEELASKPGPIRDFLQETSLPDNLAQLLPNEFRAFCLLLNAVKQWVSAEQGATDRYLLGGRAREMVRSATDACVITGEPITRSNMELHHPARDGRPPIPVLVAEHRRLEGQASGHPPRRALASSSSIQDPIDAPSPEELLMALRREGNRSWIMLRRGCLDLLGQPVKHSTDKVGASSRSFARKAREVTGKDFEWILAFLDERGLGRQK